MTGRAHFLKPFTKTIECREFIILNRTEKEMTIQFEEGFINYCPMIGRPATPDTTDPIRVLTLRKDGQWRFKGRGRLYAGESIEFDTIRFHLSEWKFMR